MYKRNFYNALLAVVLLSNTIEIKPKLFSALCLSAVGYLGIFHGALNYYKFKLKNLKKECWLSDKNQDKDYIETFEKQHDFSQAIDSNRRLYNKVFMYKALTDCIQKADKRLVNYNHCSDSLVKLAHSE